MFKSCSVVVTADWLSSRRICQLRDCVIQRDTENRYRINCYFSDEVQGLFLTIPSPCPRWGGRGMEADNPFALAFTVILPQIRKALCIHRNKLKYREQKERAARAQRGRERELPLLCLPDAPRLRLTLSAARVRHSGSFHPHRGSVQSHRRSQRKRQSSKRFLC